ncbi:hypothetical protein HMPREF1141_1549 [Clostridium sp. MSTE9]|nr:hypothetical protein HMPREF1141_1549 [Clostridium sp. MSTE9]
MLGFLGSSFCCGSNKEKSYAVFCLLIDLCHSFLIAVILFHYNLI